MSHPSESRGATPFSYRAVRADGATVLGELAAVSREAAGVQLASLGLFPLDIRAQRSLVATQRAVSATDLALGLRLLASLLTSGLALERALGILPHVVPPSWSRDGIMAIRERVREGESLSRALERSGLSIPRHVTGMIEAGELSGALANALRASAELVEAHAAHRAAVRAALAYPAVLAVAGTAAVALLAGVVLPRFASLLDDVGQSLPFSAQLLLGIAALAATWWLPALVLAIVALVWFNRRLASERTFRQRVHAWLLTMPLVGELRRATAGARLAEAMAGMLAAGVPLATAFAQAGEATGDEEVTARLRAAREDVIRGERISKALDQRGVARASVVQLIRAGESSGDLVEMLRTAARLEDAWGLARLRLATRLIEPLLILAFGAVISFVAAALLQAVYSIRPVV